jgi:hypothetical protein
MAGRWARSSEAGWLEMLDELTTWGLRPPVLVADAGYGQIAARA